METFAPVEFYDLTTETIPYVNFLDFQILSTGNDGIVIKFDQSPLSQHPELTIAKFYYQRKPFNLSLHETLNDIDSEGQYFAQYFPVDISTLGLSINEVNIIEMSAVDLLDNIVTLSPNYLPLDETRLTKKQYRHLRHAVELLTTNNIIHNDLPGNVMQKSDGTPVLIDFAQSHVSSDENLLRFQHASFLQHFKVVARN